MVNERVRSANHDLLARACEIDNASVIVILGEGNFHQVHGGIATNADADNWESYADQYQQIRGIAYQNPTRQPDYFSGHLPPELNRSLQLSMEFFHLLNLAPKAILCSSS